MTHVIVFPDAYYKLNTDADPVVHLRTSVLLDDSIHTIVVRGQPPTMLGMTEPLRDLLTITSSVQTLIVEQNQNWLFMGQLARVLRLNQSITTLVLPKFIAEDVWENLIDSIEHHTLLRSLALPQCRLPLVRMNGLMYSLTVVLITHPCLNTLRVRRVWDADAMAANIGPLVRYSVTLVDLTIDFGIASFDEMFVVDNNLAWFRYKYERWWACRCDEHVSYHDSYALRFMTCGMNDGQQICKQNCMLRTCDAIWMNRMQQSVVACGFT